MGLVKIGVALLIVGIVVFALTFVRLINGSPLVEQTNVPGTLESRIEEAGRYYVWDYHWTTFEGKHYKYPKDCPSDAQVVIHDASGAELQFIPDASQSWSIGNNGKKSVG